MNGQTAKILRQLVAEENPAILLALMNAYGEKTKEMDDVQIYRAAKKLYKRGYLSTILKKLEQN